MEQVMQNNAFELTINDKGIGVVTFDLPGESMNVLRTDLIDEISRLLNDIEGRSDLQGLIIRSGKSSGFIAGADVSMLDKAVDQASATAIAKNGQDLFDRIENLSIPVVAAIHGVALGGGLEFALACHYRVISDSDKTVLGVPEVQLGLLPGSGGTQRLPRKVGLQQALQMILTGKQIRAKQAKKMGLADAVVNEDYLIAVAERFIAKGKPSSKPRPRPMMQRLLENTPVGRKVLFSQARKQTLAKTRGNYPAAEAILDVLQATASTSLKVGLEKEAEAFGKLVMTPVSKALRQLFFTTTEMKKTALFEGVEAQPVERAAVLGGGLMGGGIAFVTATKAKTPVRIKDIAEQGINNAMGYAHGLLNKRVKRRQLSVAKMQKQMSYITGTTDFSGLGKTDILMEAVFENTELKQQMVADMESQMQDSCIFATNTSSIPIADIASKAQRPENVIGLHYFSPVEKMPLAEVIPHQGTSEQTIATTVEFARKQGKTPIVVKDGAGFYVNRILAPYMNEAATLLLGGESIDGIDKALVDFGFPVGPMKLLDEVGIEIGVKIAPILENAYGERFKAPDVAQRLLDDDRKGKKNNRGLYLYSGKQKGKAVDSAVYGLLGVSLAAKLSAAEIAERCVLRMLNEAALCLQEGSIRSAKDGDIGAIFGIGFPPFLGGPFMYMDTLGIDHVVARMQHYQQYNDVNFTPAPLLLEMKASGKRFY